MRTKRQKKEEKSLFLPMRSFCIFFYRQVRIFGNTALEANIRYLEGDWEAVFFLHMINRDTTSTPTPPPGSAPVEGYPRARGSLSFTARFA